MVFLCASDYRSCRVKSTLRSYCGSVCFYSSAVQNLSNNNIRGQILILSGSSAITIKYTSIQCLFCFIAFDVCIVYLAFYRLFFVVWFLVSVREMKKK